MSDIPVETLSEHIQQRLSGSRVLGALFLTYEFDPGFFEQEVLPAVLDVPVSHASAPRLLQLEAALREVEHGISVFYDWQGLRSGDYPAPRLDIRRIPVRLGTRIFHTKNLLILTEDREANDEGAFSRRLLVACMSANLTRSGWWENVETCHVESLVEGEATRLRDPLAALLGRVQRLADSPITGEALAPYRKFVNGTSQQIHKTSRSDGGALRTHLYVNGGGEGEELADFLADLIPRESGYRLEILSPFFDKDPSAGTLKRLIKRLDPEETRIFLPTGDDGAALVSEEWFESVRGMDEYIQWGRLPEDLLRLGRQTEIGRRRVHAKVYRVFKPQPKREFLFVGSANLTAAAHSGKGGNVESGFLVQIDPPRRPDFWLQASHRKPAVFTPTEPEDVRQDDDDILPVQIRFSWKTTEGYGRWDGRGESPALEVRGQGAALVSNLRWPSKTWVPFSREASDAIRQELVSCSLLVVRTESCETHVLVQEEDGVFKPELAQRLPVRDILHFWALLTEDQRQEFIEGRAQALQPGEGTDLIASPVQWAVAVDDMFTRCAGMFHAFASLERRIDEALLAHRQNQAVALLFGARFDSLGTIIGRVGEGLVAGENDEELDDVDAYVLLLCARQLMTFLEGHHPDFWSKYGEQVKALGDRLRCIDTVRTRLSGASAPDMPEFLTWFERRFLNRATPMEQS